MSTTVNRAFELARNGACRNMKELRLALKAEKCDAVEAHLGGWGLSRQLQAIMKERREQNGEG